MLFLDFCKIDRSKPIINIQKVMWLTLKLVLKIQIVFVHLMINLQVLKKPLNYFKLKILVSLYSQLLSILLFKVFVFVNFKNKF